MPTLKKKDLKFCPRCGSNTTPQSKGPGSKCSACDLLFTVNDISQRDGSEPQLGKHTHKQECIGRGKNSKGKVCHSSVAEAYARSLDLVDIPFRHRGDMQFYKCRWCEKFHMGHGGKGRKNATATYSFKDAKEMYEQAVLAGEIMGA